MPDDAIKPEHARAGRLSGDPELAELRRAALQLARRLGSYGVGRADEIGAELEAGSEDLIRDGRSLLHELRERVAKVEARVEHAVRDHPGQALAGLLGIVGFGLILGLILRRKE